MLKNKMTLLENVFYLKMLFAMLYIKNHSRITLIILLIIKSR